MAEQFDVIVIGGGPAGSTTATLLAKQGWKVLMVEQAKFPRYHIGESMVPGILPVLDELGLTEEVARLGLIKKYGGTLIWGKSRELWEFTFNESGPFEHSYQIIRSEFDTLLLRNARRNGVVVLEETRVMDVLCEGERCIGITYATGDRASDVTAYARFVVDASGQSALLARKLELLEWDEGLKNIAIWAYYQGGQTLDGRSAGNILIENMDVSWLWHIPLHDGTQSVGLVTPATEVKGRKFLEEAFERTVASSIETSRLLASARRVSHYHTARDWSYISKRFYGQGFLLVGDAAGFVDPLFSTGVFLAMNGATLAAKTLQHILEKDAYAEPLLMQYERLYREFLGKLFSFIHFFYDASREKERYWEQAQQIVDPFHEMGAREDFVYLISGLFGAHQVLNLNPLQVLSEHEDASLNVAAN